MNTKSLLVLAAGSMLVACNHDALPSKENVTKHFQSFEAHPDEKNLRQLLNLRTDGEVCYLHMALMGKALAQHPQLFKTVSGNITTEMEHRSYRWLADLGEGVFEYYPEHEPKSFDDAFQQATWLKSLRTPAQEGN